MSNQEITEKFRLACSTQIWSAKAFALQGYSLEYIAQHTGLRMAVLSSVLGDDITTEDIEYDSMKVLRQGDTYLDAIAKQAVVRATRQQITAHNIDSFRQELLRSAVEKARSEESTLGDLVAAMKVIGMPKPSENTGLSGFTRADAPVTGVPRFIINSEGSYEPNPEFNKDSDKMLNGAPTSQIDVHTIWQSVQQKTNIVSVTVNSDNEAVGVNGASNAITADLTTLRALAKTDSSKKFPTILSNPESGLDSFFNNLELGF